MMEEEIIQQEIPNATADAREIAERRRSKSIINKALRAGVTMLENRGQTRAMLPGLHYAAMNILIQCMHSDVAVDVLSDRMRGIVGISENADAPPIEIAPGDFDTYTDAVVQAGQTFSESLMAGLEALETEGLDNRFPETVLDASLGVLLNAWGADHVRRAILEQTSLLIRGVVEPNNFMEPSKFIKPQMDSKKDKVDPSTFTKDEVPLKPPHKDDDVLVRPQRHRPSSRRANAYLVSDMAHNGVNAWVLAYRSFGNEREEDRLVSGYVHDHSGRAGWVQALHECILIICSEAERVSAKIDMSSEMMIRAIEGSPGSRLEIDGDIWQDFDAASSIHDLEFRYISASLQMADVDRCDFKIREILSQQM